MSTARETLITAAIIGIAIASALIWYRPETVAGSTINLGPTLGSATTSTSIAVTTSSRVLATTTNALGDGTSYTRIYATICNPNANPVYISLNGDKPASNTSSTYVIAAAAGYNVCYEINDRNPYNGSVTASSTNQTSTTISVSQYVY